MAINLDKSGAKIMDVFKRQDEASDKTGIRTISLGGCTVMRR